MYNKTAEDVQKVFDVVDKPLPDGKEFRDWNEIADTLNSHFNINLTKKQWKNQYEGGKNRLAKTGSPESTYKRSSVRNVTSEQLNVASKTASPTDMKTKLKKYLLNPKTLDNIKKHLAVDDITALGLIQSLKLDNLIINFNEYDDTYSINKSPVVESRKYVHSIGATKEVEFVVISCSHWASKKQQKSFVNFIYDEAVRRNITDVYHCGDIVDGYYKKRPEHIYELIPGLIGADDQVDYVVNNWPHKPGITTHLILGNHDETHIINGGVDVGKAIVKGRKALYGESDFKYLGIGHAKIELTPKCRMDIFHPLDGSSYAISYSGQKYMDSISGGDKPNILFVGHHHKALYFSYRNIHYFEVPSMMAQSSWMKRKRIANESGAWFVKLTVDEEGTIVRIIPEHIKQYVFLENDF